MKYILCIIIHLLSTFLLMAQKKYDIGSDELKEWKRIPSNPEKYSTIDESYNASTIRAVDTVRALSLVYRSGREYYVRYFNHRTRQMEAPEYARYIDSLERYIDIAFPQDTIKTLNGMEPYQPGNLDGINIDTNWLYQHVRYLKASFWSERNGYSTDDDNIWAKRDKADSVDFIKEWSLFAEHLGKFKNLERLVLIIEPTLITHYLGKEFYLPPAITTLKKLRRVDIDSMNPSNEFVGVPMELFKIKKLEELRFRDLNFRNIEVLVGLNRLKKLHLICSIMSSEFPVWLYDMKKLEGLAISIDLEYDTKPNPGTYALPAGISKLKHLKFLAVGMFDARVITKFPIDEICSMKSLRSIHIYSRTFFYNEADKNKIRKSIPSYFFSDY